MITLITLLVALAATLTTARRTNRGDLEWLNEFRPKMNVDGLDCWPEGMSFLDEIYNGTSVGLALVDDWCDRNFPRVFKRGDALRECYRPEYKVMYTIGMSLNENYGKGRTARMTPGHCKQLLRYIAVNCPNGGERRLNREWRFRVKKDSYWLDGWQPVLDPSNLCRFPEGISAYSYNLKMDHNKEARKRIAKLIEGDPVRYKYNLDSKRPIIQTLEEYMADPENSLAWRIGESDDNPTFMMKDDLNDRNPLLPFPFNQMTLNNIQAFVSKYQQYVWRVSGRRQHLVDTFHVGKLVRDKEFINFILNSQEWEEPEDFELDPGEEKIFSEDD